MLNLVSVRRLSPALIGSAPRTQNGRQPSQQGCGTEGHGKRLPIDHASSSLIHGCSESSSHPERQVRGDDVEVFPAAWSKSTISHVDRLRRDLLFIHFRQ